MVVSHYEKMRISFNDFFSKCEQIRRCSHLLKISWKENFIFYALYIPLFS